MKPIRLFEYHEQRWIPKFLRQYITDYLGCLFNHYHLYDPITPLLAKLIKTTGLTEIIDLCSGSGRVWEILRDKLEKHHQISASILLTDKFPNTCAIGKHIGIQYYSEPVDLLTLDKPQKAIRTIFTAFHHFNHQKAKVVLQQAVSCNDPIAIFEFNEHHPKRYLFDLIIPLSVLHLTPKVQPKSKRRLLFTYVCPIIPLMVWWDGWVSNLRTYSVKQLHTMVDEVSASHYTWEIGTVRSGLRFYKVTYLIGYPKQETPNV